MQSSVTLDELVGMFGADVVRDFLNKVDEYSDDVATKKAVSAYLSMLDEEAGKNALTDEQKEERATKVRVGITSTFSFASFKAHYPNIELIKDEASVVNYDLIVVPGGADIDPSIYGKVNTASDVDLDRDKAEVPLVKRALSLNKKILGVCRGHQLVNALKGCEFIQDLHGYGYKNHPSSHELVFSTNSGILAKYFKDIKVNSMHHQAVVNTSVRAICTYNDIIEGCEGYNIVTTQFHPEFMENTSGFFKEVLYWAALSVKS